MAQGVEAAEVELLEVLLEVLELDEETAGTPPEISLAELTPDEEDMVPMVLFM